MEEAAALIMEGRIKVDGRMAEKRGDLVSYESDISISEKMPYVSRGGLKIEGVFNDLKLTVSGKLTADIGSSTGGFTDYFLKNGAKRVIAIDVGYGLLDWKLRNSKNVDLFEKTNIRYMDLSRIPYVADLSAVDLSFITIKKIINKVMGLTVIGGEILLLFKPQFELERSDIKNKGIVRDPGLHARALKNMIDFLEILDVTILDITFSKLKGTKGNIEFWIYLKNSKTMPESVIKYDKIIEGVVDSAHSFFMKEH